jgi:uncharacterized membrane protein YadS
MSETHHTLEPIATDTKAAAPPQGPAWRALFAKEDGWSIWLALLLVALAYGLFASGTSIRWLAVAPAKWTTPGAAAQDLLAHAPAYVALYLVWAVLLSVSLGVIGQRVGDFLRAFTVLFVVSIVIFEIGAWTGAAKYNLEPPLVALVLGLAIANLLPLPAWLEAGLRVEYYIKIGIILLGATLPFTLLVWAGPVAVVQASIVSLATFFVIYFVARRLGVDPRYAAVLGVGGAVCGVSAAIAIAGAVRAKREHASAAITLVIGWAIVMIFLLPFVSQALGLPTGIAGAWIGTSEFADAAGAAAAQAYGDLARHAPGAIAGAPEASVQAFTLMKVVGRDIWIGIWALVLAIVATTRWETRAADDADAAGQPVQARVSAGEIWKRFPKFVLGFVIASAFVTWVAGHYTLADYRKIVVPQLVAPITALRVWAFIFCFLSIGLSTRLGALTRISLRPLLAFTAGVVVNVLIGYVLSVHVFASYWAALG